MTARARSRTMTRCSEMGTSPGPSRAGQDAGGTLPGTAGAVERPALLTHVFYPADRVADHTSPAHRHLRNLWTALLDSGLTGPVGENPTNLDVSSVTPVANTLRLYAAVRKDVPGQVHAALACQWHDVIAVTVMNAPNTASVSWTDLDTAWTELAPKDGEATLGGATIYLGLIPAAVCSRTRLVPSFVAPHIRGALPDATAPGWENTGCRTRQGFLLWELPDPHGDAAPLHRCLAALAPPASEEALDRWVWSDPAPGLVPFTRYLIHAAKARYERKVLFTTLPELYALRGRVDETARSLFAGAQDWTQAASKETATDSSPSLESVVRAQHEIRRLRVASGGLSTSLGSVRAMAQTLQIAKANMQAAVSEDLPQKDHGPLAGDIRIADLTLAQARAEESYLSAAYDRAGDIAVLAEAETGRRLSERQAQLTLWQTSLLGGLIMLLAAIQSLSYKVPLPGGLAAPTICLLGSLALALPILSWHWSLASAPPRRAWVVFAGCAAIGASSGWLIASLLTHLLGRPGATVWTALAAAAGAVVAIAAGYYRSWLVERELSASSGHQVQKAR